MGDALVIGYFIFYSKRIKAAPERSAVYDIRDEINKKFLKDDSPDEENSNNTKDEEAQLKDDKEKSKKPSQFTIISCLIIINIKIKFLYKLFFFVILSSNKTNIIKTRV